MHPSLGGGDSVIRHDENVPKGSANFAVKFSNDTQPDAVYDACVTKVWGATVVGLIVSVLYGNVGVCGKGSHHHSAA